MSQIDKKLLTPTDLQGEKYNIPRCRAYTLFNLPDFPVIQIGRRKYVHVDQFEKWLKDRAKKEK